MKKTTFLSHKLILYRARSKIQKGFSLRKVYDDQLNDSIHQLVRESYFVTQTQRR